MKKLIDMPEWLSLKREILNCGADMRASAFTRLMHAFNTTATALPIAFSNDFTIGPGNTYQQAWAAALAGHHIRMPNWPPDMSWVFHREQQELLRVYGDTHEDWTRTGSVVCPTGNHQLSTKWEVLPIYDHEKPVI